MGSTITVGKFAGAATDPQSGKLYLGLFESTYESNVTPRTPSCSARYFGEPADCMEKIVGWSSDCEGGSFRSAHGPLTSTAYIKQWREAIAAPRDLRLTPISIDFGTGLYQVNESRRAELIKLGRKHGFEGIAAGSAFELDPNSPGALALLAEITKSPDADVRPWKWLKEYQTSRSQLVPGYTVESRGGRLPEDIGVYKFPKPQGPQLDKNFLVVDRKEVCFIEKPHMTIEWFISNHAITEERKTPGTAESLIRQFKKRVEEAETLNGAMTIALSRTGSDAQSWHQNGFDKIMAELGRPGNTESTEVTLGEMITTGTLEWLPFLAKSQITFGRVFTAPRGNKMSTSSPVQDEFRL